MRNIKKMEKQLDDFFKEQGLEEEISKLSKLFEDNFMIQGTETEDLSEALRRAPDSLIDLIWDKIVDKEATGDADRAEKEKILYDDIQEYLKASLLYMDLEKLQLLIRVMNMYPVDMMETVTINEEFVPFGWAFIFVNNGKCSFAVMKELRQIIMTMEEPGVRNRMMLVNTVRCIINTCLGLYGVCKLEHIFNVYKGVVSSEETENIDEMVRKLIPVFEEQKILWSDGEYMISPYIATREEYKSLLNRQKGNYFIPDDDTIRAYGFGKFIEKTDEYKAVQKHLSKAIKDSDMAEGMLEEIAGHITRDDWGIPQVMNCLYDWEVAFDNPKAAEHMTEALSEWIYGIRRWSECGYSRKELGMENEEAKFIAYAENKSNIKLSAKKVYPNAPCPCGSGKKYKKCCGR